MYTTYILEPYEFKYHINQDRNNANIKKLFFYLANKHDIKVKYEYFDYFTIVPNVSISNGIIKLKNKPSWLLAIHELCHLSIIEPNYRYLMDGSTETSYKRINRMYPQGKEYRRESVTLALQHLLFEKYDLYGSLYGTFFNGSIRDKDLFKEDWIEKATLLFNKIDLSDFTKICDYDIFETNENIFPKDESNVIVESENKIFSNVIYRNGNFLNAKNFSTIYNVSKWSYKYG